VNEVKEAKELLQLVTFPQEEHRPHDSALVNNKELAIARALANDPQ